jgi:hypothetical protein
MKRLVQEKERAVALRKKGLSYNEILQQVPVAKSSLSLWLKDLELTKDEKKVLKNRMGKNISHGRIKAATELRKKRLAREVEYVVEAKEMFERYVREPKFHAGIAMYWAEGAKTSTRWLLINTDLAVIELMVSWLKSYVGVSDQDILFRLFIHKPYADNLCEEWWQNKLEVPRDRFLKTVYKETVHKSKRKTGHHGCLRIEVKESKKLLFMMKVLQNVAVEYYRKQ